MSFGIEHILVFLVVLGVLVFVHELGHFVAAKLCNVYVDRFSLGMPPRLFGFKFKETDYCIGLLPIGGYVKMAGQEDAPLSEEEREQTYGNVPPDRWFNNKPVWQRAFILVAGPAMNIVLAVAIYALMAGYGREVPLAEIDNRIGYIEEESPADSAPLYAATDSTQPEFEREPDATGWQAGDRIVAIDGKPVNSFQDILVAAILGGGSEVIAEIERPQPDGTVERYLSPITAQRLKESDEARRFGVMPFRTALIEDVFPASPAMESGIAPGDIILWANGQRVDQATFSTMVRELEPGTVIDVIVQRDGEHIPLTLQTRREGEIAGIGLEPQLFRGALSRSAEAPKISDQAPQPLLREFGLQPGEVVQAVNGSSETWATLADLLDNDPDTTVQLVLSEPGVDEIRKLELPLNDALHAITGVDPRGQPVVRGVSETIAEKTGLQKRDRIVQIEGRPATAGLLYRLERERIGETIEVTVERPQLLFGLLQKAETFTTQLEVTPIQQIGVLFGTYTVFRREAPANILPYAIAESWRQVEQIGQILSRLLTGGLSPKLLGGPVMIGDAVTTAYDVGFFYLLDITAMISVNLAVFNLLPLPILDGGQLVFLLVEAIRRRPVSMRVMETVQQVGFIFIIGLLLFVTFNDVSRIVERFLP